MRWLLFVAIGCTGKATAPPDPIPIETEEPLGFPDSEGTEHDVARDTGGLIDDTSDTGSVAAEFEPAQGLFVFDEQISGGVMGIISLHEEPWSCTELFGQDPSYYYANQFGNKPYPDDYSWYIWGDSPRGLVGTHKDCGQAEGCFLGYYYIEDAFGALDGTVTIEEYTPHYVTVSWSHFLDSGGPLTFYNCGDRDTWRSPSE